MRRIMSKNCFSEIGKLEIEGRFKKSSVELADHGGWLICDGRELDRKEYAELFAIIGTSFGAGDGKTTFNLPDFSDKMAGNDEVELKVFIFAKKIYE